MPMVRPRREPGPEVAAGQREGVRGVGEGQVPGEVAGRRDDHQQHRQDHHGPHHGGDLRDVLDAPPQQPDHDGDHGQSDQVPGGPAHVRGEVAEVLHEADHARGHDQRDEEHRGPHEQERHQLAAAVLERLPQIHVTAAGTGHRRAEFGPHQAVGEREHGAGYEADHRLRAAERAHHQRDRDERADAAHLAHVDRGGLEQADTADESAGGRGAAGHGCSGVEAGGVSGGVARGPSGGAGAFKLSSLTNNVKGVRDARPARPHSRAPDAAAAGVRTGDSYAFPRHA